jgi:hypothetical protein
MAAAQLEAPGEVDGRVSGASPSDRRGVPTRQVSIKAERERVDMAAAQLETSGEVDRPTRQVSVKAEKKTIRAKKHDFKQRMAMIRRVPALSELSEHTYYGLAMRFEMMQFEIGDVIMREGDSGSTMYFLITGRPVASTEKFGAVKVFTEGDFFGELATTSDAPRTATVTCRETTTCVVLTTSRARMSLQRAVWR